MNQFESLIDPTEFGLIADYLRSPRAPIDYLLHVKSRDMLAPLAKELDAKRHVDVPPWAFPEPVERGLREGALLISSRHPLHLPDPKQIVEATNILRRTSCYVIYAPPFYLVHTPGLFEGTLIRQKTQQKLNDELHQKQAPRIKI